MMDTYKRPGVFITVEGIEWVGKSTVMAYIADWLKQNSVPHTLTREPGGTPVAEAIRAVFLQDHKEPFCQETELLLLFAARCQHVHRKIKPALMRGDWVVSDRFIDSSYAYQGGGRRISLARIDALANWLGDSMIPDRTFLLDLSVAEALSRKAQSGFSCDRIEQEQATFFERARAVYLQRAEQDKARYVVIDASQSPQDIAKAVCAELAFLCKV